MFKLLSILFLTNFIFCNAQQTTTSKPQATTTIPVCCPSRNLTYSEEWNYYQVRPNANLFYWLYYEDGHAQNQDRPLFIWLQGGPGASGVGYGNFEEIGPLDTQLKSRNTTWLSKGDLLFVDSPVGTGYSYVTKDDAYTTDVDGIASDLTNFTINFMTTHPQFKTRPFYIVCESYGGKVAAVYAWHLYTAIRLGRASLSLKGVALGDSWVSPIDYVDTWPDYLYYFSRLSFNDLAVAKNQAKKCDALVASGKWLEATTCWDQMETVISQLADNVSWYNVMKHGGEDPWSRANSKSRRNMMLDQANDELTDLMNGKIREKLGIIPKDVTWGGQSGTVFDKQSADFMKPVIDTVDSLLNYTHIPVFIYNGQFDLICDTAGTELWMSKLTWPDLKQFQESPRQDVKDKYGNKETVAYYQTYKNLHFFSILKAGHMVPADTPTASLTILDMITG
jgi:serine carboxypeptidase 1